MEIPNIISAKTAKNTTEQRRAGRSKMLRNPILREDDRGNEARFPARFFSRLFFSPFPPIGALPFCRGDFCVFPVSLFDIGDDARPPFAQATALARFFLPVRLRSVGSESWLAIVRLPALRNCPAVASSGMPIISAPIISTFHPLKNTLGTPDAIAVKNLSHHRQNSVYVDISVTASAAPAMHSCSLHTRSASAFRSASRAPDARSAPPQTRRTRAQPAPI